MKLDRNPRNSKQSFASQAMRARFVSEYLIDLSGKDAAIRAGYSETSAESQASKLLSDPKIRKAINKQIESREKRTLITADRVLAELYEIAMADIADAFDEKGNLKDIRSIPEPLRRAISGIEVDELWEPNEDGPGKHQAGWTKKVKFWDKAKALETLAKHLKLLEDKTEVNVTVNLGERLRQARAYVNRMVGPTFKE